MIMKDVVISITGVQQGQNGPQAIELVTQGQYGVERDKICFSYQETELTGMDGTLTTFRVEKDMVTMTREGAVNSQMLFQKGRKHLFLYDTPFGAMTMGVSTQKLSSEMDEHGGVMDLFYSVDVDNILLGKNVFRICVKEIGNDNKGEFGI